MNDGAVLSASPPVPTRKEKAVEKSVKRDRELEEVETPEEVFVKVYRGWGKLLIFDPPIVSSFGAEGRFSGRKNFAVSILSFWAIVFLLLLSIFGYRAVAVGDWDVLIIYLATVAIFLACCSIKLFRGELLEISEKGFRTRQTFFRLTPPDGTDIKSSKGWQPCVDKPSSEKEGKVLGSEQLYLQLNGVNVDQFKGSGIQGSRKEIELAWLSSIIQETQQEFKIQASA